jgi:predicted PurR-regulated permease PerM
MFFSTIQPFLLAGISPEIHNVIVKLFPRFRNQYNLSVLTSFLCIAILVVSILFRRN